MDKSTLVQMLLFYAADKERHHFAVINLERSDYTTYDKDVDIWLNHAANSAGVSLVKGKLEFGKRYLVSRGEDLAHWGLKSAVTLEYCNHWPWDFCYLYKL